VPDAAARTQSTLMSKRWMHLHRYVEGLDGAWSDGLEIGTAVSKSRSLGFDSADERRRPALGAPRIHGELLKLGIEISQTTVAEYLMRKRGTPSPSWRSFLRNQAAGIAAIDMFVVVTASFRLLCVMRWLA
jgi:hypothetical protein